MAAKRSNLTVVIVFAVAAVLVVGAGAAWVLADSAREKREAAEAARHPPTLPEGPLKVVHAGVKEVRYLALATVKPAEGGVSAVVVTIAKTPTGLPGGYALESKVESLDCAAGRLFEGRAGDFDADGRLVSATIVNSGARGRPAIGDDAEVPALCGKAAAAHVAADWRAAQREVQTVPDGFEKRAEGAPKDAALWARLCAAEPRGRWRPQAPKDCDHAVALNPEVPSVRLDRGFLQLVLGHNAAADADFRAVAEAHPDSGAALFGHSLVLALGGDKVGARAQRIRALDLEPGAPDWIETNYKFQISDPYRGR